MKAFQEAVQLQILTRGNCQVLLGLYKQAASLNLFKPTGRALDLQDGDSGSAGSRLTSG